MEHLSKNKLFNVVIFFSVVLLSGHALRTIYPEIAYIIFIPMAVVGVSVLRNRFDRMNKQYWVLLLYLVMIISTVLANFDIHQFPEYVMQFGFIFVACGITQIYSFNQVVHVYLRFMTFVSAVALVGYVLLNNTSIMTALPVVENVNGVEYGVALIYNYITIIPERNCGVFWEPGLFATNLIIAIVLELMTKEKADIKRLILFFVCIFTANSSAGFALCFLCVILFMARKKGEKQSVFRAFFLAALLCVAIVAIVSFDSILMNTSLGDNEYFAKLSSDSILSSARVNAISHNIEVFFQKPLFGAGYSDVAQSMIETADTSTSTYLMSVFGVIAVFYTGSWLYSISKLKDVNVVSKLVLFAIVLIIVNKEPHHYVLFTWILHFYLIKCVSNS